MARIRKRKNKEMSMFKIHEILRLRIIEGRSYQQIAASCQVSKGALNKYLTRAREAGIDERKLNNLDEDQLRSILKLEMDAAAHHRPQPDFVTIHQELKKKSVTLALLWEEYKEQNLHGYQYSQFCERYKRWRGTIQPSMRQVHKAGQKTFVDYAGDTVPVYDRSNGQVAFRAQIFVACLGASQFTFAEASRDQTLNSWINSHVRCFEFFKGAPEIAVIDNLKSGVSKPCRYEPDLNPGYTEMAQHYGLTVIPARVKKPKDKAKVENSVLLVERWILARLRKRKFFSLQELNRAIADLLDDLNDRPFQKLPGCRRSQYEQLDRPALKPLPEHPYRPRDWKKARVHIDHHVELEKQYYSVPYQFIGQVVDIRYTDWTVEIYSKNKRIASHARLSKPGQYATIEEHRPKSHREYNGWSPQRFQHWASQIGPSTARCIEAVLNSRRHVCQAYRSCLGILGLSRAWGNDELEAACEKALAIQAFSYKSILSILKSGLYKQTQRDDPQAIDIQHGNIRGAQYYQNAGQAQEVIPC